MRIYPCCPLSHRQRSSCCRFQTCTNFLRCILQTYAWGTPEDGPLKERIARWTIAIVYALKMHLRRGKQVPDDLRVSLLELNHACSAQHVCSENVPCEYQARWAANS